MNWFVALLWMLVGAAGGAFGTCYLVASALNHPVSRLGFFRRLAHVWPEEFERALLDAQLMSQSVESIEFKVCKHCEFPWPLENGKLIEHSHPMHHVGCEGSKTKDYHHDPK